MGILGNVQNLSVAGDGTPFYSGASHYGTKVCDQSLPYGSITDIENEVKDCIQAAAKGGGYIIAPAHIIQADTKIENIVAFFNAVKKFGQYPL
jgi:uroporphyrinogen decarboxylase